MSRASEDVCVGPGEGRPLDGAGLLAGGFLKAAGVAGRSGVDSLQRAWHNHLAPVRVSMRPTSTSLVQTSEHLLATECRQCRRSPAVNEAFLQEICRNLTNRT